MASRFRLRAIVCAAGAQVRCILESMGLTDGSGNNHRRRTAGSVLSGYQLEKLEARQLLTFSAALSAVPSMNEGSLFTVNLVTTGNETVSTWTVDWGDTTPPPTPIDIPGTQLSATHVFTDGPHTYTPIATVKTNGGTHTYNNIGLSLDPTFGPTFNGKAVYDLSAGNDFAYAMKVQNDGKFLVAGVYNGSDFALTRYNVDGSIDTSFGSNGSGRVTTDFATGAWTWPMHWGFSRMAK